MNKRVLASILAVAFSVIGLSFSVSAVSVVSITTGEVDASDVAANGEISVSLTISNIVDTAIKGVQIDFSFDSTKLEFSRVKREMKAYNTNNGTLENAVWSADATAINENSRGSIVFVDVLSGTRSFRQQSVEANATLVTLVFKRKAGVTQNTTVAFDEIILNGLSNTEYKLSKGHIDCDDARIKLVKDTDATLSSLTALPAVLSPVFNSGVYSYTATVSADTQAVTLSATATDEDASVVSETVGVKNLETGVNTFVVKCVADDGITYKEYTVVITRETPPAYLSDNSLSALSIEGLSLSPSFSGETLAYTTSTESATVPLITAIPTVDGATVDIQKPETFRLGRNEILITVTALDGTQKCYLVAITYNPPNLYGDNTLKELHMNGKITLSPAFSSEITTYKGATKFTTIPEVVATPNDSYARVAITKPFKFIKGENTITITVTALNGTTKDYYIIITCNPSDGGGGGGGGGAGFGGVQTEPVTPTRPSGKFNDLNGYDWALDAIDKLVQKSIVSGTSATTFEPAKSVNRAEFAKLVVSAFGLTLKNDKVLSFSDVNSAEWYKQYVDIAVSNGIVTGYENNTFRPDNTITREEMCVMLARALKNYELPNKESKTFADENKVSGWATDAVSLLSSHSIINGKGNDMFAPLDNASRAESAVTISRILTLIGK